jgi:hypothetical protein
MAKMGLAIREGSSKQQRRIDIPSQEEIGSGFDRHRCRQ